MCEGLLRLTVDRIFPAPQSSTLSADVDNESLDSDTPERTGILPEAGSGGEAQANQVHIFGKWRPVTTTTPSCPNKEHSETLSSYLDSKPVLDARVVAVNPSAQGFSLRGRHLTRRSLARAERGVLEVTAVQVLTAWWRSIAEERRKIRSRKLRAIAEINTWVARLITRRRALRACFERSASVIQVLWRRASARMSKARNLATACILVQTMWRRWQLDQRCSARLFRSKVSSGLQTWARAVLSRRQKAKRIIIRAVITATTRQKGKRHAAAVIVGGLKMACNRRRRSRLQLQRFARMPCLLQVRLTALSSARIAHVESIAATIVARAIKRGVARAIFIRATLAVRTLQCWSRRMLQRWKDQYAATVMIQQAWRQAKQRRIRATGKLSCMTDIHLRRDFSLGVAEDAPLKCEAATAAEVSTTNTPVCAVALGKVTSDGHQHDSTPVGVAMLDVSGSWTLGSFIPHSQVDGTIQPGSQCPRIYSPAHNTAEKHVTRSLLVPVDDGEYDTSLAFCNELLSLATTAREGWTDPALCLGNGGMQICHSHSCRDSHHSYNEGHCGTAVITIRGPGSNSGTTSCQRSNGCDAGVEGGQRSRRRPTPRTTGPKQSWATHERILELEDILPNLKHHRHDTLLEGKRRGRSELLRQYEESDGIWHTTKRINGCRGLGDATSDGYCCDMRFPYPPAGGAQPISTRAPCMRRLTQSRRTPRKADDGFRPACQAFREANHRGKEAGSIDCAPPPSSSGIRLASQDGARNPSIGRNRKPTAQTVSGFTSAKHHSRKGPPSRSARAKDRAKRGVGVQDFRYNSTMLRGRGGSIRYRGDGGVLEMLAFMEA